MDLKKSTKDKLLTNARSQTEFYDIAEPYEVFRKLSVKVTPQLEEVDFFAGARSPEESDYVPRTSHYLRKRKTNRKSKKLKRKELQKLLKNFETGRIAFVGPAGSGKTTLLKAITRTVLEEDRPYLRDVEVVHYIQCRDYKRHEKVTTGQMLFGSPDLNMDETEIKESIEFARKCPKKVLFVLDSLDTLPYTPDGVYTSININDAASPEAILWHFLSGKLFPGCRIISSSREHAIRNYIGEIRPEKVVALAGLSKDSMREIIVGYLGEEEGKITMQSLKARSPSLVSLCSTPVFLVFTLIGMKLDLGFIPKTMSGIMVVLLQCIIRSPHAHEINIQEVLLKLQKLSFFGTEEGRILFPPEEFEKYGMHADEVRDLTIFAPKKRWLRGKMFKGSSLLFFSHQSLQETLSALYIIQMQLDEFENFIKNHVHNPKYAVIRRILCGIMLDEEVYCGSYGLIEEPQDLEEKKDLLKASIMDQVKTSTNQIDQLELYISMHEARSGLKEEIKSSTDRIEFDGIPLSSSDIHAIGSIISHCDVFDTLMLRDCSLNSSTLDVLATSLQESKVVIRKFFVEANKSFDEAGFSSVGRIADKHLVSVLDMEECDVTAGKLKALNAELKNKTVKDLSLDRSPKLGTEGVDTVGEIVRHCDVDRLFLARCELNLAQLQTLQKNLEGRKLMQMSLSEEKKKATHEEVLVVVKLLPNITGDLWLEGWELEPEDIQLVQETLNCIPESKLKVIFRPHGTLTSKSLYEESEEVTFSSQKLREKLENFVENKEERSLVLSGIALSLTDARAVANALKEKGTFDEFSVSDIGLERKSMALFFNDLSNSLQSKPPKCRRITARSNPTMGNKNMEGLAETANDCGAVVLDVSKCCFSPAELLVALRAFEASFLEVLIYNDTPNTGREAVTKMGQLAKQCQVGELQMARCQLTHDHFAGLSSAFKDMKKPLIKLDISEDEKAATRDDVESLLYLFPYVSDEIVLKGWKLEEEDKRFLQEEMRKADSALQLSFDEEVLIARIHEEIPEFTTEKEVTPDGGVISLAGCRVTFPKGAIAETTTFSVSVRSKPSARVSESFAISPTLTCRPNTRFAVPVTIDLPVWLLTDDDEVEVEVLCQSNGQIKIVERKKLKGVQRKTVTFDCVHFTDFWTVLRWIFFGRTKFRVQGDLFFDLSGNFVAVVHSDDDAVRESVSHFLIKKDYRASPYLIKTMQIQEGEEVGALMDCRGPNGYAFLQPFRRFEVTRKFAEDPREFIHFTLRPLPAPNIALNMRCEIKCLDAERDHDFILVWPEPDSPPNIIERQFNIRGVDCLIVGPENVNISGD